MNYSGEVIGERRCISIKNKMRMVNKVIYKWLISLSLCPCLLIFINKNSAREDKDKRHKVLKSKDMVIKD